MHTEMQIFIRMSHSKVFLKVGNYVLVLKTKLGQQFLTIWPASTNLLHFINVCK